MALDKIRVQGAREHNLKNVSVELPRDSLLVFTGLSGSGKSTIAYAVERDLLDRGVVAYILKREALELVKLCQFDALGGATTRLIG